MISTYFLLAGMPSISLNTSVSERLQAISFFLVLMLLSTLLVKFALNSFATAFGFAKFNYRQSLGVSLLWGLASVVVLVMISGARELMTPGAWERKGLTHQLADRGENDDKEPAPPDLEELRRQKMIVIQGQVLKYALAHEGRFPQSIHDLSEGEALFELPPPLVGEYVLMLGQRYGERPQPVVIEPYIDREQWVMMSDGALLRMSPVALSLLQGDQP